MLELRFHWNQGSPLSPALLSSAFPQVLSPFAERDRFWWLWSNFKARKGHISLKCIFEIFALFLFSSEYTKISVCLNFAVPPLFPFLFSLLFLPDALRSLFVQAEVQLCEKLSKFQMVNLTIANGQQHNCVKSYQTCKWTTSQLQMDNNTIV